MRRKEQCDFARAATMPAGWVVWTMRLPGNGSIRIFVNDVDRMHADLVSRGANVIKAPQNYDYGMHDLDVVDPDGNHLTFGMECP
jgi:uncharacterized glyoxalase superfamily protein PhnB